MTNLIELSVDIAMNNLGWVCFEAGLPRECGVIKPEVPKELLCLKGNKKLSKRQENVHLIKDLVTQFDDVVKRLGPALIVGEATPGGAKNASAAVKLNIAFTAVLSICLLRQIKYEWCTPDEVKKATIGNSQATKEQIMDWAIARYGGSKDVKEVNITRGKRAGAVDRHLTYRFLDELIPGGTFEHIADACGAYEAVKHKPPAKKGARGYTNKPRQRGKRKEQIYG